MQHANELIYAIEYLESWGATPTKENIKKVLEDSCKSLYSFIGKAAHEKLLTYVEDETEMSWEEQDLLCLERIKVIKEVLALLEE